MNVEIFPIIKTKNLILRDLKISDYKEYFDYLTDDLIRKQFLFDYDEESCKEKLNNIVKKYQQEIKPFIWAVTLNNNNELIGIISLDNVSFDNKSFSVSYGLRSKYRGKGYMYESVYELIDYMFNYFDFYRVELAHNIDNIASHKIIEKLGAVFEGVARESKLYDGIFKDRKVYSILKREWNENKKRQ